MKADDLLGLCVGRICVLVLLCGMFHTGFTARSRSRTHAASKGCEFPSKWAGTWFQKGVHPPIKLAKDVFSLKGKCLDSDGHMFYIEDTKEKCKRCVAIYEKHPNVLQYRETFCDGYRFLRDACSILTADAPLYSLFRVDAKPVSCELHGPFTFTYSRGHGECEYPMSTIDSCTDDSHLLFRFQACADVLGTESSVEELTCTAVWKEGSAHYLVGKISTRKSYKQSFTDENAYRCFVFDYADRGVIQMSQSADATCDGLVSPWEGSRTMKLSKSKHPTSACQFPSWVTSNHKWHTLDGRTTYTFKVPQNNSFKVSSPHQEDTKFICIEYPATLPPSNSSSTVLAYSTSGCKNGYICMKFHKRDNHIIEIQYGELARSAHEACYSLSSSTSNQDYVTLVGRTVPTSGCPQLVETNEVRVHVVKPFSASFRPALCPDNAVKIAGCRSSLRDSLEFLISCATYTDVKSFHCHGSWEEDGKSYLVTGLRNTGYKYCFVYWTKDKGTHLAGVHDTCRRSLDHAVTEHVAFNISSTGVCDSNLISSSQSSTPHHLLSSVVIPLLMTTLVFCLAIR
ncbi:hypothetical protein JTE90_001148 [Oedothorax gibbosus]|uniref:Uncharacterized protein n=1 Tax=Oedothorax gibbosus TaxID=931172 RepID=A0AAV6VGY0_9ARAC|nr:hypothetical protein JTE90_001148 [Oedothorax gibbosus]